jgi:two-component system OmpR family sensor kinase
MRSATSDRAPPPSDVGTRVARVAIVCAALGGLVAAATAIVAVDRLIAEQAEQRLRAATVTLAGELDEHRKRPLREVMGEVLDDENEEIATSGIRLAVVEQGRVVAGDRAAPAIEHGVCGTFDGPQGRVRACARGYRGWSLVAAQATNELRLHVLYALSLLLSLALGGLAGALSSRRLSRWAVGPLQALATTLRASRPGGAHVLELGDPSDVREVEEIREALADRSREIERLLEQASRFAADAAHELRTPLTVMRTELELMLEEGAHDAAALARVIARVERLTELVNRLLILALPTGNLSSGFEAVALSEVAEDVIAELPEAQRARVRLQATDQGIVHGDAELLRSLVANGLGNALKFAAEGPVEIRVATREAPESTIPVLVALEVKDQGPGVPPELRERVFEPFRRLRTGSAPGHGLGLALVGHIARVHGGVAALKDSDRGAHLEVLIPGWRPAE